MRLCTDHRWWQHEDKGKPGFTTCGTCTMAPKSHSQWPPPAGVQRSLDTTETAQRARFIQRRHSRRQFIGSTRGRTPQRQLRLPVGRPSGHSPWTSRVIVETTPWVDLGTQRCM